MTKNEEFDATTIDVLPDGTIIEIDEYRQKIRRIEVKQN